MVAGYGHLPTVQESPDFDLVAVCERDDVRRAEACEKYGVAGYGDLDEMLAKVELDSATLCTTLPTHHELGLKVAAAGLHCFAEKPLASTADQCDELVEAFDRAGRLLVVNFENRLTPLFVGLKADLDAERLGTLLSLRFLGNWDNHWHRPDKRPRRAAFLNEGFGCIDCGIHMLDMARWLSGGEYERVRAEGTWAEPEFRYPSHIHMIARMTNGVMVSFEHSFAYSLNAKDRLDNHCIDVVGDRGVIRVTHPPDGGVRIDRTFEHETIVSDGGDGGKPWTSMYTRFASAVRTGSVEGLHLADGRDGAAAVRVTEQIIADCNAGRVDRVAAATV